MTDPQPVNVPPTFKTLLPFVRRAEELDRDTLRPESKLIAYFCRQYAMELGIKLRENDSSNEATDYLLSLMDRLEREKEKLPEFTHEEGKEICEDFAMEIFSKADDEDRAGMASKSTARTFYAAGTFFDILNQFGEISTDIVEKRRYCKYKAAMILKAIKEGNTPTPGPPDEMDMKNTDEGRNDVASVSTATASTPQHLAPAMPISDSLPLQPADSSPFLARTDSMRSAGAMSASELDSAWHGPLSAQPPVVSSAPSYSAPTPRYPSPTAPTHQHSVSSALPTHQHTVTKAPPTHRHPATPTLPAHQHSATPTPPAHIPPLATDSAYSPPSASAPLNPPPSHTFQKTPVRARNTPVSQSEINDAIELAKFAVAALKVKDMKLAEERLEMALRNIRGS